MWSDQYHYLNIYGDTQLNAEVSTRKIREFLNTLPQLMRMNDFKFRNTDVLPFTEILLLKSKGIDSWSDYDTDSDKVNLIVIVSAKTNEDDFSKVKEVLEKIASFLNWQLSEDEVI